MLKKVLAGVWILTIISIVSYFVLKGIHLLEIQNQMQIFISSYGIWAGLVFVVLYAIRPLIFFPSSVLTPLAAVLFGSMLGWVYAFVGALLSATVAFFMARYFGRHFVQESQNVFIQKYDAKLKQNAFETILTLRLIPLFPFDFVNYVCGLSAVPYRTYIIATLIGILPGLTAYIFLGGALMNPWLLVPTVALFAILIVGSRYYKKKKGNL